MSETNLKQMIVEKVESYLKEKGFGYEYDEAHAFYRSKARLHCELEITNTIIVCKDNGILFDFSVNKNPNSSNMIRVMEFVTRANYDIYMGEINGSFQMGLDDNRLSYGLFLTCEDVPTYEAIDRAYMTGGLMLEKYGDALLAVMLDLKNARDAIEAARKKTKV